MTEEIDSTEFPMSRLRRRVLTTRERVKFADADPYGHLASGAYVDMIMSHRVEALQDLIGFSISRSAKLGIAFPARNISVSFARPAFVGDLLEVASWIEKLGTSSFEIRALVVGVEDRAARAYATIHFVTVDARTGRPLPTPEALPTSASIDPDRLPRTEDFLADVRGLPHGWLAE
jgi:acyl-CoA thioester hydrolase